VVAQRRSLEYTGRNTLFWSFIPRSTAAMIQHTNSADAGQFGYNITPVYPPNTIYPGYAPPASNFSDPPPPYSLHPQQNQTAYSYSNQRVYPVTLSGLRPPVGERGGASMVVADHRVSVIVGPVVPVREKYACHRVLACFVSWFCCCLFGAFAYALASTRTWFA